jgi:excisionase family DNA binding protein
MSPSGVPRSAEAASTMRADSTPSATPAPPIAVTIAEAARLVGLSARTLWAEIASGRLRVVRVRRRTLIRYADLTAWFESWAAR